MTNVTDSIFESTLKLLRQGENKSHFTDVAHAINNDARLFSICLDKGELLSLNSSSFHIVHIYQGIIKKSAMLPGGRSYASNLYNRGQLFVVEPTSISKTFPKRLEAIDSVAAQVVSIKDGSHLSNMVRKLSYELINHQLEQEFYRRSLSVEKNIRLILFQLSEFEDTLDITAEVLAESTCSTRQLANKILKDLTTKGVISRRYGVITVVRREELADLELVAVELPTVKELLNDFQSMSLTD